MKTQTQFSDEQQIALDAMLTGKNVFLTGNAGTGKSLIIKRFKELSKTNTVFVAPTGVAAIQIEGCTAHSLFNLPIGLADTEKLPDFTKEKKALIRAIDTLVIDEASLMRVDFFQILEEILRKLAPKDKKNIPWGGKQVIVVADFLQLPAFAKDDDLKKYLQAKYKGLQAFNAPAWKEAEFLNFYLEKAFRQKDDDFFQCMLDAIRLRDIGFLSHGGLSIDILNSTCVRPKDSVPKDILRLCTTNRSAKIINEKENSAIHGKSFTFKGKIKGNFPYKDLPVDNHLEIKEGSRVMLRTNKYTPQGNLLYHNGEIGTVTAVYPSLPAVDVKLKNGRIVSVEEFSWTNYGYKLNKEGKIKQTEIGSFCQLPLSLAWATTIHRAQGLTLTEAFIILGDEPCFCPGQLYVALSRVTAMKNLYIDRSITANDIIIDKKARLFYENLFAFNMIFRKRTQG